MTIEELIKKLVPALADEDTAKGLESFGIKPEHLEGLKDLKLPTTLNEALKIKGVQSEYDQKLQKAADTREAKLKKKFGFGDQEEEDLTDEEDEPDVKDPATKLLLAQMKKMGEKLETLEKEKAQESQAQKQQRAEEYLKSKNIPAIYRHALDLDKDFEEQFEELSEKVKADGVSMEEKPDDKKPGQRLPFPNRGNDKNEPSKEEVERFEEIF